MTLLWAVRLGMLGAALASAWLLCAGPASLAGFLLGAWTMVEVYVLVDWWCST